MKHSFTQTVINNFPNIVNLSSLVNTSLKNNQNKKKPKNNIFKLQEIISPKKNIPYYYSQTNIINNNSNFSLRKKLNYNSSNNNFTSRPKSSISNNFSPIYSHISFKSMLNNYNKNNDINIKNKQKKLSYLLRKTPKNSHFLQKIRYSAFDKELLNKKMKPLYYIYEKIKIESEPSSENEHIKKHSLAMPQPEREDYKQKVNQRKSFINPGIYENPFLRHVSVVIMLDKIEKEKEKKQAIIERKIFNVEVYDKVPNKSLEDMKILDNIKNFLTAKDSKLNQALVKNDIFYSKFENKVNFLYDINLVPNFKNNLVNNFLKNVDDEIYIICNNYIDHGINIYLNKLKVKIQKRKDEKLIKSKKIDLTKIKNLNEEKQKYYNNLIKDDYNILDDYIKQKKNLINSPEQIKNYDETIYELNDFFENKYIKYKNVKFTNERIKEKIFNFYIKNLY
jgi:hypothetical protein